MGSILYGPVAFLREAANSDPGKLQIPEMLVAKLRVCHFVARINTDTKFGEDPERSGHDEFSPFRLSK